MTRMRGRWADIGRTSQQQLVGGRGLGQADQDARAAPLDDRAGRRDAPAHRLDEALGARGSEAGAFVAFAPAAFGRLLQPSELLEHALDVGLRNARALVL